MLWKCCFVIALVIAAVILLGIFRLRKRTKWNSKGSLYLAIVGAFLFTFTLLLPYFWQLNLPFWSRLMLTFHGTAQAFTFDIDGMTILETINAKSGAFYSLYCFLLSPMLLICPIFTISLLLTFVKNFWARVRLAFLRKKPIYVFSNLNEMSLSFASSIVSKEPRCAIVFCNAFAAEEESKPELLDRAQKLHAICFNKDASYLPINRTGLLQKLRTICPKYFPKSCARPSDKTTKRDVQSIRFVMLGTDEGAELAQALELAKLYGDRNNTTVTLFSSSQASGSVIDSVQSSAVTIGEKFIQQIETDPEQLWKDATWRDSANLDWGNGFYMQRIDPIRLFAVDTLSDADLIAYLKETASEEKIISLMIVGLGGFGKRLLQTAVWMYQVQGYTLHINVFDKREEREVKQVLEAECPELLIHDLSTRPGDASHDIRIFPNVDCFSAQLEKEFADEQNGERLRLTQVVFVTLGDDDQNIEAAIRLRTLFDRQLGITNSEIKTNTVRAQIPRIYSVVFNDEKQANWGRLRGSDDSKGLVNYKDQQYQIQFIGSMSSLYSYSLLEKQQHWERMAILRHIDWMRAAHLVKISFENQLDSTFHNALIRLYQERAELVDGEKAKTQDASFYEEMIRERIAYDPLYKDGDHEELNMDELKKQLQSYYQYEYYRESSIATYLHKKYIVPAFLDTEEKDHPLTCICESCIKRRITEHMRWNAYMRSIGYCYGAERCDRGKIHSDLVPWQELEPKEWFKD